MRVKATCAFYDRAAATMRAVNEVFEATEARASELAAVAVALDAPQAAPAPQAKKAAPARKKAARA